MKSNTLIGSFALKPIKKYEMIILTPNSLACAHKFGHCC